MPGELGSADQGRQGPTEHAGLGRVGIGAEIEDEIGLCDGQPVGFRSRGWSGGGPEVSPAPHATPLSDAPITPNACRRSMSSCFAMLLILLESWGT